MLQPLRSTRLVVKHTIIVCYEDLCRWEGVCQCGIKREICTHHAESERLHPLGEVVFQNTERNVDALVAFFEIDPRVQESDRKVADGRCGGAGSEGDHGCNIGSLGYSPCIFGECHKCPTLPLGKCVRLLGKSNCDISKNETDIKWKCDLCGQKACIFNPRCTCAARVTVLGL